MGLVGRFPTGLQRAALSVRQSNSARRGLYLVGRLARRWGTRYTDTGKTIWVEQALPSQQDQRCRS